MLQTRAKRAKRKIRGIEVELEVIANLLPDKKYYYDTYFFSFFKKHNYSLLFPNTTYTKIILNPSPIVDFFQSIKKEFESKHPGTLLVIEPSNRFTNKTWSAASDCYYELVIHLPYNLELTKGREFERAFEEFEFELNDLFDIILTNTTLDQNQVN